MINNNLIGKITGSEIDFYLEVNIDKIKDVCQDIWDNPGKYSEYTSGTEDAYYKFTKHLWVEISGEEDKRLVDLVVI